MTNLELVFDDLVLEAELFEGSFSTALLPLLPLTVEVTAWGDELYGEVPVSVREEKLVPEMPPGGLAWTSRGNYFCVFFGQQPAWPVEPVGRIKGTAWQKLRERKGLNSLILRLPQED